MQSSGRNFRAKLINFTGNGDVCLDLAKAYDDTSLKNLFREVSFKKNELLLKDTYVFDKCPTIVKERFITKQKPEVNEQKVTIYTDKNEEACIFYKADAFDVFVNKYIHISHEKNVPEQIYAIDFSAKSLKPTIELVFSIQWN